MDIFSLLLPKYKIGKNKKIRLISLFSGYDSQKLAFNYIGVDVEHYRTIEFDKYAMQSLNEIHNTNFETKDITKVSADELGIVDTEDYTYILTYSFPCTDLSLAGKRAGMDRESGTRSGLLWEVERLLKETKEKPQILIMENVPQVLSAKGWREWNVFLESLGYSNYCQILNAKDFGIPQNRERCFMVSILGEYSYEFPRPFELKDRLKDFLEENVDEKYYLSEKMMKYVCSRMPMGDNKLNIGINMMNKENEEKIAGTICTSGGNQPNDNFIIDTENVEYDSNKGWFGIIDSYNKYMPKDQNVCGVIPAGYYKNQGTMIMEKNMKTKLCNDLIENGVVKENFYNKQYLGTYQFAKSEAFMNGKDRFEPNKEFIDCILTSQKVGVVEIDKINIIGKYTRGGFSSGQIVDKNGITPTVMEHHGNITAIVENDVINPLKDKTPYGWHFEQQVYVENGIVRTIKAGEGSGNMPKVIRKYGIFDDEKTKHQAGSVYDSKDLAPTLDTMQGGWRQPCIEIKSNDGKQWYQQDRVYDSENVDMCNCENIPSGSYNYQLSDLRIRKLTPCECFKLMGVKPSDYNKITCSNAQKYKQAGNSIVTTCLMAIYSQLFENVDYKYYIEELLKELRSN